MRNSFVKDFLNFKNKVILITGATGQLGNVLCKTYSNLSARVIGVDVGLNRKMMHNTRNIEYITMDISNKKSVLDSFKYIYSKYKKLDVLINNAGVSVFEPFEKRPGKSFDLVMDVNLKGTFLCIQTYANYIRKQKKQSGIIVNVGSVYGLISPDPRIYTDCDRKNSEVYGATKAGIIQMTKYFAVHLAKYNIRVNCISPGGIYNPRSPQGKDFIKQYSSRCPLGRMAKTDEITGGIIFLSSGTSGYITGQNLVVDGGMTSW